MRDPGNAARRAEAILSRRSRASSSSLSGTSIAPRASSIRDSIAILPPGNGGSSAGAGSLAAVSAKLQTKNHDADCAGNDACGFADTLPPMPRSATRSGAQHEPDQPSGIKVEELGRLIRERRGALSIRQAAADAGVSFSTLARVEASAQPDLATFTRLCAWLAVPPEHFFRPSTQRAENTIDRVTSH